MSIRVTADEILAHPRFAQARTRHIDAVVRLFRADPLARHLMADAGVIALRGCLVGHHLAFDPDDRTTWATPGNLKRALVARGVASSRRVDHLLAHFRQAGHVTVRSAPNDRRSTILDPVDALIAHDRDHLAASHGLLLDLFPGRGYAWVLDADAAAHRAIQRAAFHDPSRATSALRQAAMRLFLARDAGYLALLLVARAHLAGEDGPTWTAMSGALGVARSHLRNVFTEAEAAGYVRLRPGRRSPIEILPAMWDAYDRFLAEVAADQDVIAQAAFAGRR